MRVLIIGSSGRPGEQLADSLAPAHTIVGVDRRAGPRTTHVGDIADADFVAGAAAGAEAILHTASLHAPDYVTAKAETQLGYRSQHNFAELLAENR